MPEDDGTSVRAGLLLNRTAFQVAADCYGITADAYNVVMPGRTHSFRDAIKTLSISLTIGAVLGFIEFLVELPWLEERPWLHFRNSVIGGAILGILVGLVWMPLGVIEKPLIRIWVAIAVFALLLAWIGSLIQPA